MSHKSISVRPVCVLVIGPGQDEIESVNEEIKKAFPRHHAFNMSAVLEDYFTHHVHDGSTLKQVQRKAREVAKAAARAFRNLAPIAGFFSEEKEAVVIQGFPCMPLQLKRFRQELPRCKAQVIVHFIDNPQAPARWRREKAMLLSAIMKHADSFHSRTYYQPLKAVKAA